MRPFKVNVTKSSANFKESFEYLERTCPFRIAKLDFKYLLGFIKSAGFRRKIDTVVAAPKQIYNE